MGIGMRSVYWVEVLRLIPTANHLDRAKLDAVLSWCDPEDLSHLEPLCVASDEALNLYLLDGHCRAWALWATGVEMAPVVVSGEAAVFSPLYAADIGALQII